MAHYMQKDIGLVELSDWLKPEFAAIDQMSMKQFLAAQGASAEALRLMDVNIAARNLSDLGALDTLRKNFYYAFEGRSGPTSIVSAGMDALPGAMAASLKQPVQMHKVVTRMQVKPRQVTVTCQDGSSYKARLCITTIPLSIFKNIHIDGPVPALQRKAWQDIRYSQLIQVYMNISAPYWERDGMTPGLWTDGPIERIYHWSSATEPLGVLSAFINGEGVDALNKMTPQAIGNTVLKEMNRLRPATAGVTSVATVHNWATRAGHIAYYAPGDIGRYAEVLTEPVGALYFAGEHCGKIHAGLEAACEAAENAVVRALDDLDKA
jgi:monoamine oxidase